MLGSCHLGGDEHARLLSYTLEPGQGHLTVAFKTAGFGAGFPDTGTEHVATFAGQLQGGLHHLLLSLRRTGSGNDYGAFVVAG